MNKLYDNILQTIGNTPIVKLNKLGPRDVNVYVKVESFNPMGSVKDRLSLNVIETAERNGTLKPGQTVIEANADAHVRTTGPEILEAFEGRKLDYWVSGFGTGGTLKGVSSVLKARSPETKIIVCEPDNAQILASGIPQERLQDGTPKQSHPLFRPHLMQGWTPDFIPKLTEDVVAAEHIDGIVPIDGNEALRLAKALAQQEGIFVGTTAGATLSGAIQVAEQAPPGSDVLCMLPDTGERYQSTPLFDDVREEMDQEEVDISMSTPNFRFGAPPPAVPPADDEGSVDEGPAAPPADAVQFLADATHDDDNPVVLFALEWYEFCWSVRKMFAHYEIPYRSIDLDSVAYQEDNRGGAIRMAIEAGTGLKTIPQIYIGGATDLFDGMQDGSVKEMLETIGVAWNQEADQDPYSFLPKWLHIR